MSRAGLVGRDAEIAVLDVAVAQLKEGRGRSILVSGEPGIGKSALGAAVRAAAESGAADAASVDVLYAACDELGRRFPLSALLSALRVVAGAADPVRAEAAAALLGGVRPGEGHRPAVGGGDAVAAATEVLAELVDRLCAARPVLLVVDDLHWADDASLELWAELSRAAAQLPLVLIGLHRPTPERPEIDSLRAELDIAEHGFVLDLAPLAPAEVARLATDMVGGRPGPRLAGLLASAAGNPLYLGEIVGALHRADSLVVRDGVAEIAAASSIDSLAAAIADRLDFLSPSVRTLLQAAALQGLEFTAAEVADASGVAPARAAALLGEAVAAGVIEAEGDVLRFRHGLIRQAMHASVPRALRVAMYRDAALRLIAAHAPVERTAEAVLLALEATDGWELGWLSRHAEELVHRAPTIAVELIENALRHAADDDRRIDGLQDQLVNALFLLGRYPEAERGARRILAATGARADSARHGWACWVLGYALLRSARFAEAMDAVREEEVKATTPLWAARLTVLRAMILNRTGETEASRAAAQAALEQGEALGDAFAAGYALHSLALRAITDGDQAAGLARMDRALALIGDEPQLADLRMILLSNRATVLDTLDRYEEAVDSLRTACALGERAGTARVSMLRLLTCTQAFNRGQWDDAIAELEALRGLDDFADGPVIYHGMSALIAAHRDDAPSLERHLRELDEGKADAGWPASQGPALMARAMAQARAGRFERAIRELEVYLDPEQERFHETRADWLPAMARIALAAGDADTARRAAEAARAEAEQEPLPYKLAMENWCRGLVESDAGAVHAAVEYFRRAHRPLELGNTLEDEALLRARNGEQAAARDALTEAMSCYADVGAAWDARRAVARLRGAGVRLGVRGPRQRPDTGWAALTETELRVADLVAQGMSNPDIAVRLLLSRRTVQTHVSHILGKLGARSRREIAGHARRAPRHPSDE